MTTYTLPQTGAISAVIALILDYFPGIRLWFDSQSAVWQRNVSLVLGVIVGVAMFLRENPALNITSTLDIVSIVAGLCLQVITAVGSMQLTKKAADATLAQVDEGKG